MTSLDMQGCSLTLTWLDDELETYWRAACDTPVLRKGETTPSEVAPVPSEKEDTAASYPTASAASRESAACIVRLLGTLADDLRSAEDMLGQIDAVAGDGDHGQGMARGSASALKGASDAAKAGAGAASVLGAASDAWADRAGGTSGAIWGILLRAWGGAFSDQEAVSGAMIVKGARAALDTVMRLGGAKPGDKTLIDAFVPFVETLEAESKAGSTISVAWEKAAAVATASADQTSTLSPKLGRARPLAHLSIGHPDAGAISLALCARSVLSHIRSLEG